MLKRSSRTAAIILSTFLGSAIGFAQASGADTFKAKCAMCHGSDGLATISMAKALGVPSYKAPEVVKLSDAQITAVIKDGKDNKMPPFKTQLTDAQIKEVVLYIHTLQKK